MRIAMIGQKGIPANYGGVERAVEELSAQLVERGHEVTVFNRRQSRAEGPTSHRGIRLEPVPATRGRYSGNLTQSLSSATRVLGRRFDIVHFHALGPCVFAPLVRFGSSAAVVATVQGRDDQRAKWNKASQALLRLGAWSSARVPHEVITVSRQLKAEYERDFGRQTHHIPNGFTPIDPVARTGVIDRLGLSDRPYLLTMGRLVPEKAVDHAIEAIGRTDLDVRLVIVGGSSHTNDFVSRLETLAADDERVVLAGPVYGEERDDLFGHAAAFVMPSLLEGLPLALLEAIGLGLPAVVSDIPPHLEVVGDGAGPHKVFPAGDIDSLAAALEAVVADLPYAGPLCEADAQRIRQEYSWDRITTLTEDVYRLALA